MQFLITEYAWSAHISRGIGKILYSENSNIELRWMWLPVLEYNGNTDTSDNKYYSSRQTRRSQISRAIPSRLQHTRWHKNHGATSTNHRTPSTTENMSIITRPIIVFLSIRMFDVGPRVSPAILFTIHLKVVDVYVFDNIRTASGLILIVRSYFVYLRKQSRRPQLSP